MATASAKAPASGGSAHQVSARRAPAPSTTASATTPAASTAGAPQALAGAPSSLRVGAGPGGGATGSTNRQAVSGSSRIRYAAKKIALPAVERTRPPGPISCQANGSSPSACATPYRHTGRLAASSTVTSRSHCARVRRQSATIRNSTRYASVAAAPSPRTYPPQNAMAGTGDSTVASSTAAACAAASTTSRRPPPLAPPPLVGGGEGVGGNPDKGEGVGGTAGKGSVPSRHTSARRPSHTSAISSTTSWRIWTFGRAGCACSVSSASGVNAANTSQPPSSAASAARNSSALTGGGLTRGAPLRRGAVIAGLGMVDDPT